LAVLAAAPAPADASGMDAMTPGMDSLFLHAASVSLVNGGDSPVAGAPLPPPSDN
jgi:hypothetical protein